MDTDGDGLTDSYHDCSDMGFYSTLDSDAGDNAGEGFDDGDLVGITDDTTLFGGAAAGNQWFQVSDTDGVFRMYFDHATGVSAVSMWIALASTDYEEEDYYASYWVGDDGTTTSWATPRTRGATSTTAGARDSGASGSWKFPRRTAT